MTTELTIDGVWWAPFDTLPGAEGMWHALRKDPRTVSCTERAWAVCDWVGYVHFSSRTLSPIFCFQCWRVTRHRWPAAEHRVVTPESWRAEVRKALSGVRASKAADALRGGVDDAEN